MNIGEQIAKFRKEKHLTQEQLGESLGVTNRTISKWESGLSSPGVDLIPSIASALGITLDQLYGIVKTNENTDNTQKIKEIISSSIDESLYDLIEGALDDALSQLLPKYLSSPESKDEHSVLIISRDKSTVCRFFGQGQTIGPIMVNKQPPSHCISIPAQGGNVLITGYSTKEAAAEDLERIFKAYTSQMDKIEL